MSKGLLTVVGLAVLIGFCKADDPDSKACFLRNGDKAAKPFPSLTQCYKNNQNACCVSAHDATIESAYANLLSSTCLREYQELEHYFCLGCNPNMFDYIQWYSDTGDCDSNKGDCKFEPYSQEDYDAGLNKSEADGGPEVKGNPGKYGMIKICDSFLESMLYTNNDCNSADKFANCPIDKYDNCGLNLGPDNLGCFPSQYFDEQAAGELHLDRALTFLNEIRPPYFNIELFDISYQSLQNSEYHILSDDYDPSDNTTFYVKWTNKDCFDSATNMHLGMVAVLAALVAHVAGNFM